MGLWTVPRELSALRAYFASGGAGEWWWVQDATLAAVGNQLRQQHFAVVEHFLPKDHAAQLLADVKVRAYVVPGGGSRRWRTQPPVKAA